MSRAEFLLPRSLGRRRSPVRPIAEFLDRDAGPLDVMDLPHQAGTRPIAPQGIRDTVRLGNPRFDAQLWPGTSITARTLAHVTYAGLHQGQRAPARNASGALTPAKVVKRRPWLFGGSLTRAVAEAPAPGKPGDKPCLGC